MKRQPFAKKVSNQFIEKNMESNEIVSFNSFDNPFLKKYFYDELKKQEVNGFPISSIIVDNKGKEYTFDEYEELSEEVKAKCRLRFYYLPNYHELYIGTTGSGKTTGCIEPQIRAISSQKNKANLFITDPKGELFEHNARHLKENGYRLFILNFKNLSFSDAWNPLEEMYDKQMETLNIGKGYKLHSGEPDASLKPMSKEFKDGHYFEYKGMAFATHKDFSQYTEIEKYMCRSQISSLINQFCSCVFLDPGQGDDRTWIEGSRGLMYGILLTMLEEAIKPETTFTKEMMTLKTLNDVFVMLRDGSESHDIDGLKGKLKAYLKDKSVEAMTKINTCIATADVTRQGYLSVFQSEVEKWMQGHIFQLTAETTIDLNDDKHPWAIFVATRDYDKSDNTIAGLFIDWAYRQSLYRFEKCKEQGKKSRPVHFLLDEFANIPKIPDFDNKIATARSREIWFHLFIQSYEQLDLVYGRETASIIIDNCNQQSFLGSQSQETKDSFSKECGYRTVTSLGGEISGKKTDLIETRVVPLTALDRIHPGMIYTKRLYSPVIKCNYIRSYQCANAGFFENFFDTKAYEDLVPLNPIVPNSEERTYAKIMPNTYFAEPQRKFRIVGEKKEPEEQEKPEEEEDDFKLDFDFLFNDEEDEGDK